MALIIIGLDILRSVVAVEVVDQGEQGLVDVLTVRPGLLRVGVRSLE